MPTPLTIVATIEALPGHETAVEKALKEVVAPTLAESGCLQYDLHQDLEKPGRFLFYENWATREEWDAHMESAHLAVMKKAVDGKLADLVIFQMERV